ncbi:hypothetical protein RHMOL_Rhmol06G0084400 [Rhododendron molle]|uniref:Uncharacterized protein n=1 Tax=Rhododendron molle TaxID=49168 RepID=A0ACC0NAD1_RHOML|nr:hypothetical protein RHMOL_Rhmol06G0084400 [Rhododendron molle]
MVFTIWLRLFAILIGKRLCACGTDQTCIPVKEDFVGGGSSTFLTEQGERDKISYRRDTLLVCCFWVCDIGCNVIDHNSSLLSFPKLVLGALSVNHCSCSRLLQLLCSNGGVIAGLLAACALQEKVSGGILSSSVVAVADLIQEFETGHLTLTSSESMFVSQLVGTAIGCVISPLTFWLYWSCFDLGSPYGLYSLSYAVIYREMAIVGVEVFTRL